MLYVEGDNHVLNAIGLIEEANREISEFIGELIDRKLDREAEKAHGSRCKILEQAVELQYLFRTMWDHDHE